MGFGPIQGIPPLPPVVAPRAADVDRVFAAEFNQQQGREAAPNEDSRRGLESDDPEEELADAQPDDVSHPSLDLFA